MTGHTGEENLPACLKDADVVVIPAGVPRKPGMTRDDLFNINAGIVKKLAEKIAVHCPQVGSPPAMHEYCLEIATLLALYAYQIPESPLEMLQIHQRPAELPAATLGQ